MVMISGVRITVHQEVKMSNESDWNRGQNWKFPYRDYGLYGCLEDPKYIKDRNNCFKGNNGWWWGPGWWSDEKFETPMEYHARKRKERGE